MAVTPSPADAQILVVDDEPDLRTLYELALQREGYNVLGVGDLGAAWQALDRQRFDVVITAYGSAENAVESLKVGAFDYLTKPVDIKQFRAVVASAVQGQRNDGMAGRRHAAGSPSRLGPNRRRTDTVQGEGEAALQRMVGDSVAMRLVKERVAKVARSMAPVLGCGESGTGKELVARALHANSHRFSGPMVAVNCGAIPETLLEAEFFGVKKGAYTGAAQDRAGFFQAAQGGSLFLDEIGDLPLAMQSKLLRAIQERCVRPVGAALEEPVDVRIISATHRDLAAEVEAGRFRQDLYYRLNVIDIVIPPLRERLDDLPALCENLLARIAQESGIAVPTLTPSVLEQICLAPLKGNVRELENLLHRAVALSEGNDLQVDILSEQTLPAPLAAPSGPAPSSQPAPLTGAGLPTDLQGHLDRQEREILVQTLHETGFNRTAAAARLGLSLRQMRYRIARLNIDAPAGAELPDEPG